MDGLIVKNRDNNCYILISVLRSCKQKPQNNGVFSVVLSVDIHR